LRLPKIFSTFLLYIRGERAVLGISTGRITLLPRAGSFLGKDLLLSCEVPFNTNPYLVPNGLLGLGLADLRRNFSFRLDK
jgi:hypothetical protein